MTRDTPMWVANWGNSGNTALVGLRRSEYGTVYLLTAWCEDWAGGAERARRVLFEGLGFGNV